MTVPYAASSTYFRVPKFSKGDLEEVMAAMRPHEIFEISNRDLDVPLFPFPGDSRFDADAKSS